MAPDDPIQPLDYALVGRNVKRARKHQGLSQSELAEKAEVDLASIFRAEKGTRVRTNTLRKIAAGLRIIFEDLLLDKTFTGPGVPFAINRTVDAKWFPVEDRRHRTPENDHELSQDPAERRRVGKLGLVPLFMCPPTIIPENGPGVVTFEIYGQVEGPINAEFYEDAALYLIDGEAIFVIAGTEVHLVKGDWIAHKSKDLESLAVLPPNERAIVLWIGSNRVAKTR